MYSNIMEIKFPNKSDNERFARTVAAAFVLELDPTVDQISEIKTAVSEAVTNAIIHGYDEKDGGALEKPGYKVRRGIYGVFFKKRTD